MRRRLVLASASPRRRVLLEQVGLVDVVVEPSDHPEDGDGPEAHALAKARAVAARHAGEDVVVLGADTVVVVDGQIVGKPDSPADARRILRDLSGRDHEVVTAWAVVDCVSGHEVCGASTTTVTFRDLDDATIDAYVATGEPRDKAGAYGIQGRGALLVARIHGDWPTVVGLPVGDVVPALRDLGVV